MLSAGVGILSSLLIGGGASIAQDATPTAGVTITPIATPVTYDKTDWPSELNCGLFGGSDAEGALHDQQPFADYLSAYLGMPVEYTVGVSYNAVIESMASKHTNCGTVGPFSYLLAVQEAGAEALAVEVNGNADDPVYNPDARPAYFSVISVKKGSGIKTLEDLKGKTLSFVDPASTSGHLIPASELISAGLDPDKDLETIYAGDHPTSALALWNDKVDAAASTEATLVNLAKEGQIDYCGFADGLVGADRTQEEIDAVYDACPDGSMVAIKYSNPIPNTPFAVSKDLPESLKQAIKDALLDLRFHPDIIAQTNTWYVDPNLEQGLGLPYLDNYYDPLREVAKDLDLDLKSFGS
jgi:phosphonate transport system substrate-binding protein